MMRNDERTGRVAIARRSGERYATIDGGKNCCIMRLAGGPLKPRGLSGDSSRALPQPEARRRPMRKGSGTPTLSDATRIGYARQRKKHPIATAQAWCTSGTGKPKWKGIVTAKKMKACQCERRSTRCSAQ